jgi:galactokinase
MSADSSLDILARDAADDFSRRFGLPPRWLVAAPGRVNLIGEHTDYNDGFVLPMAIDRHVVIAADRRPGDEARLFSAAADGWAEVPVRGPITPGPAGWANYVRGVLAGCLAAGMHPGPFEAVVHADLPQGGGLSSSAALEVAVATLVEAITGGRFDPLAKALLCQKAEHDFAGVPCGIMDQCSSVMGRAGELLLLDCRSRTVQLTPLADPDVVALIVNSNVKRALAEGGYAARRAECEKAARLLGVSALRDVTALALDRQRDQLDAVLYRRARHVVTENDRTVEAAAALRAGDWGRVGRLLYASHTSLRDDFEVSCAELDVLVAAAQAIGPAGGVIGARMTGGGFGGCTISLVRRAAHEEVARRIQAAYLKATGRQATVFVTDPVEGARVLKGG